MLATGDEKTLFNGDLNGFVNNEARHKTWTRQLEMRFFYDFGLSISKVRVVLFMISSIYAKLQCPSLGKVMVSKLSNLLAFLRSLILGAVVAMECHGSIAFSIAQFPSILMIRLAINSELAVELALQFFQHILTPRAIKSYLEPTIRLKCPFS